MKKIQAPFPENAYSSKNGDNLYPEDDQYSAFSGSKLVSSVQGACTNLVLG